MFTNYYNLLNISPEASSEEIDFAIDHCTLSKSLVEEIKMVLKNESLKRCYDAELQNYESSTSKNNYEIKDTTLSRELEKNKTYLSNRPVENIDISEDRNSHRFWIGVLVFILILGLKMCMSSCSSNRNIDNALISLKQELPINMEGLGKVREVDYEESTVVFRMRIRDEASSGMSVTKITRNQTLAKEIVSAQIGMMNERVKEAIRAIAGESFGLKVLICGSSSSRDGEINLSSAEIESALNNSQNKTSEDFSLEMVAMTTKLMLPTQIDQVTTWTDTRVGNDTIEYIYRLDDSAIDLSNFDIGVMKREKLTMLSQNMDLMGNVVRCCIATHRSLVCKYIGNTSNRSISVILTESDLKGLL